MPFRRRKSVVAMAAAHDAGAAERLLSGANSGPLLVEQFRNLAASLNRLHQEGKLRTLLVTSPAPGDGKSNVADMRRPTLHRLFGVHASPGLLEALRADEEGDPTVNAINEKLDLLTAGRQQPNPVGDLSSARLPRLIASAASRYDWVIVDSPPVAGLADARIVSETVDAAVLVIRAGVTPFPEVQASVDALGPERILGVILNAVEASEIRREDYYSHYYGASDE
jgi:Mrp family chromosome partitioning ATPase